MHRNEASHDSFSRGHTALRAGGRSMLPSHCIRGAHPTTVGWRWAHDRPEQRIHVHPRREFRHPYSRGAPEGSRAWFACPQQVGHDRLRAVQQLIQTRFIAMVMLPWDRVRRHRRYAWTCVHARTRTVAYFVATLYDLRYHTPLCTLYSVI